ncbi:LPS biosynthesis glycosyltransferase [Chitinophaga parva]|uniref:LPS biosynthesis glycosyltransferase n=1 Tax=Chitinophaga parva TaxID=2169414 RepID=A0A2T7BBY8_9BACT|nr:glycosyltransferase family 9 protein [Chitinophaga parva]PUZ22602.1 LPS biosynthesis glycosyltransferase [Chitinophaga parva]
MQLKQLRKIAVFRALQLGDMLCAIPALRALRHTYPDAHITLVSLPWATWLRERFPQYIDELVVFPGYPGLPEQAVDADLSIHFLRYMWGQHYDLALQMQGNGSVVNPMVELWSARYTAGFYRREDYQPGPLFLEYPEGLHEIERLLALVQYLGITETDTRLEFPISLKDQASLQALQLPVPEHYVCIHPGSRDAKRQWPAAYFARLGDQCAQAGLQVLLTGTAGEAPLTRAVMNAMTFPAIDLAGHTDLGQMGALLKNAFVLIANCTGVSHIAAALETPSLIISMGGEPGRWVPLNRQLHTTIDWTTTPDFNLVEQALMEILQKDNSF